MRRFMFTFAVLTMLFSTMLSAQEVRNYEQEFFDLLITGNYFGTQKFYKENKGYIDNNPLFKHLYAGKMGEWENHPFVARDEYMKMIYVLQNDIFDKYDFTTKWKLISKAYIFFANNDFLSESIYCLQERLKLLEKYSSLVEAEDKEIAIKNTNNTIGQQNQKLEIGIERTKFKFQDSITVVPLIDNGESYYVVSLTSNGKHFYAMFDTGYNLDLFMGEKTAKTLGVKLYKSKIGLNNTNQSIQVGTIDSLKLGSITIYKPIIGVVNHPKLVDMLMSQIPRKLRKIERAREIYVNQKEVEIIIGLKLMDRLDYLCFDNKEKTLTIIKEGKTKTENKEHNIYTSNNKLYGKIHLNDSITFNGFIDTGVNTLLQMQQEFYDSTKFDVGGELKYRYKRSAGFTDFDSIKIARIPLLRVNHHGVHHNLKDTATISQSYLFKTMPLPKHVNGVIGANYLRQFDKATFNFRDMIFSVEKKEED